jgi:hypothetical protein
VLVRCTLEFLPADAHELKLVLPAANNVTCYIEDEL